ncbi:MAG: OmpA family protein [Ignavibacteriaceae bacterium]
MGVDNPVPPKTFRELKTNALQMIQKGEGSKAIKYVSVNRDLFPADRDEINGLIKLGRTKTKIRTTEYQQTINLLSSDEYHPVVSDNGSEIYFCAHKRSGGGGGEDVFYSSKSGQGWGNANPLRSLNTSYNEVPTYISADSKRIIVMGFYSGSVNGDLFFAEKNTGDKYSLNRFNAPVNSNYFDSDGRIVNDNVMIFTSDRPNGVGAFREKGTAYNGDYWGNTDIYVSVKKDSVWQEVVNLGPVINTDMAERTPYLTPDGKYLFFSSTGHTGFGGLDVFVSKRLSESGWTEWSEPVNLGYTVNSPDDDWGFMIIGDGKTAYFSNTKDIYTCTIPDDFYNFDRQFSLQGKVKNEMGKFLNADITLTNLDDSSTLQVSSDSVKGEYRFTLDPFADYKLVASANGYNPVVQTVSLSSDTISVLKRDITLISQSQVRIDTSDGLITVFFEFNKYNLEKSFHPKLDYVAGLLRTQSDKSEVTIEIGGYTDAIGSDKYNTKLSLKRAQTVFNELIKRGLEDDFFDVKAYGESDPIAPNNTNEGRAKNRRVVLRIKNSL